MVRQIDIAKKLGVSLAVVSRALSPERGKSNNLSVNTIEKIRQVAREMGYRKNLLAMSLRRGATRRVALVVNTVDNYMELIRPIQDYCRENSYDLVLFNLGEKTSDIRRTFEYLIQGGFDAAISFLYTWESVADLAQEFIGMKKPLILVGSPSDAPALPGLHRIRLDIEKCLHEAVRHLISLGHKKIVCCQAVTDGEAKMDPKLALLMKIMPQYGIEHDIRFACNIAHDQNRMRDGYLAAAELLKTHPDATACFGYNDIFSIGLIRGLKDAGKNVPCEISVIGSDSNDFSRYMIPSLSTLDLCSKLLADAAIDRLFGNLASMDFAAVPDELLFEGSFIARESSGIVPEM
ncbi:MAG: LacI family transcriptional regulator [Lentisphaerae bacterium]|nr:LacI family transcriptional regulator [Lentisphaerota bacterium]